MSKALETMQNANQIYEMYDMTIDSQFFGVLVWTIEFLLVLAFVRFVL